MLFVIPVDTFSLTTPFSKCIDAYFYVFYCLVAWNDGKIRVFAPESGRLMLIIHNAHKMGVTAIAGTRDCKKIISGGGEGQVSTRDGDKNMWKNFEWLTTTKW